MPSYCTVFFEITKLPLYIRAASIWFNTAPLIMAGAITQMNVREPVSKALRNPVCPGDVSSVLL